MDGEKLDRVGLGRGRDIEALAELVLGLEPGQQRGERHLAVDGLELGDRLDEEVEVLPTGGRAGLTEEASSTSMPVVSTIRRTRSRIGSPIAERSQRSSSARSPNRSRAS